MRPFFLASNCKCSGPSVSKICRCRRNGCEDVSLKKVTILVVGDQDLSSLAGHDKSSKHRRAEELQAEGHAIRIVGETEFYAMINVEA